MNSCVLVQLFPLGPLLRRCQSSCKCGGAQLWKERLAVAKLSHIMAHGTRVWRCLAMLHLANPACQLTLASRSRIRDREASRIKWWLSMCQRSVPRMAGILTVRLGVLSSTRLP
jgi:hypothetical protein